MLKGAPPLPQNICCIKIEDLGSSNPDGVVYSPPFFYAPGIYDLFNGDECGYVNLYLWLDKAPAWTTYLNKLNCVMNSGRFAEQYKRQGICFESSTVVPPVPDEQCPFYVISEDDFRFFTEDDCCIEPDV